MSDLVDIQHQNGTVIRGVPIEAFKDVWARRGYQLYHHSPVVEAVPEVEVSLQEDVDATGESDQGQEAQE